MSPVALPRSRTGQRSPAPKAQLRRYEAKGASGTRWSERKIVSDRCRSGCDIHAIFACEAGHYADVSAEQAFCISGYTELLIYFSDRRPHDQFLARPHE